MSPRLHAVLLAVVLASSASAQDWGGLATISTTMGISGNRICIGETSRGDIGCPTIAPYVASNGNVGLGTATPAYTLDIIPANNYMRLGAADSGGETLLGNGTSSAGYYAPSFYGRPINAARNTTVLSEILSADDTGTNPALIIASRVTPTTFVGTRPSIALRNNTRTDMQIDANGNIGIGTTSPAALLDIAGNTSVQGYLGISTSTPSTSLHIVGNGGVSDDIRINSFSSTATSTGNQLFYRARGTRSAPTAVLQNDLAFAVDGYAYNGSSYLRTARIASLAETDWSVNPKQYGNLVFYTAKDGTLTEKMRITSDGEVGIGVSVPSYNLDVAGTLRSTGAITTDGMLATNSIIAGFGSGGTALTNNDGYGNANVTFNHAGGVPEQTGNAGRISVNTDATTNAYMEFLVGQNATAGVADPLERIMRLYTTGKALIGITTAYPSATLHVYGGGDFDGSSGASGGALVVDDATSGQKIFFDSNEINAYNTTTNAGTPLYINQFGGHVFVGGASGSGYEANLQVRGVATTCTIGNGTGATSCSSDRRMKRDIHRLEDSLEKIIALQGVGFTWKKTGERAIGLIAQDVEKQFPEVVTTDEETGMKGVAYPSLIAPLIESVKTLKAENDALRQRIEALEAKMNKAM